MQTGDTDFAEAMEVDPSSRAPSQDMEVESDAVDVQINAPMPLPSSPAGMTAKLDEEMISDLLLDSSWIEQPVIVALLRYFEQLAEALFPPRHYLLINPEFTDLVYREAVNSDPTGFRQRPLLANGATYGSRKSCDYILMPIHEPGHWTLAIGVRRTGRFEHYDPLQRDFDVASNPSAGTTDRRKLQETVNAVANTLREAGIQV